MMMMMMWHRCMTILQVKHCNHTSKASNKEKLTPLHDDANDTGDDDDDHDDDDDKTTIMKMMMTTTLLLMAMVKVMVLMVMMVIVPGKRDDKEDEGTEPLTSVRPCPSWAEVRRSVPSSYSSSSLS